MRPTTITLLLLMASSVAGGEGDPSLLTLDRIITDDEFRTESFGPARWLKGGSGYTTLERAGDGHGRDLIRYDPMDGRREVLVAAANLRPKAGLEPLSIDDYAWSDDGTRLLIFTNTRRVWRLNTRGDYWGVQLEGCHASASSGATSLKRPCCSPSSLLTENEQLTSAIIIFTSRIWRMAG